MVDFEVCGDGQISSKSFVYGINRDIKFIFQYCTCNTTVMELDLRIYILHNALQVYALRILRYKLFIFYPPQARAAC